MGRRTSIDLNERHVRTIMRRYGLQTKREAVNLALRLLAAQPMNPEETLRIRGSQSSEELPVDEEPPAGLRSR